MRISICLLMSICFINCKKDDGPVLSSENKILSFRLSGQQNTYEGEIDQELRKIRIDIGEMDLSNPIRPEVTISKSATITPSPTAPQDFNVPVTYVVQAENGNLANYEISTTSSEKRIFTFAIVMDGERIQGKVDEASKIISLETKGLENHTSIVPEIQYSHNAVLMPPASDPQNFNNEITYRVTARNGEQSEYTVITGNTPLGVENKILTFNLQLADSLFPGTIDHENQRIHVEVDTLLEGAVASYTVSDGAVIEQITEDPLNFYRPVQYRVTAENGDSKIYEVEARAYTFFMPRKAYFYANATGGISGTGIDLSVTDASLVLANQTHSFELEIQNYSSSSYTNGMPFSGITFTFPEGIVSGRDYRYQYKVEGEIKAESDYEVDVLAEQMPEPISVNQDVYSVGDVLVLTGVNLQPMISIPSNGSLYMIWNTYNYDITVNPEQTELRLTLDNYQLFRAPEEKVITIYEPETRRIGPSFIAVFD